MCACTLGHNHAGEVETTKGGALFDMWETGIISDVGTDQCCVCVCVRVLQVREEGSKKKNTKTFVSGAAVDDAK